MGIIKPKSISDEIPDTQFTSASLTNYEVSRGLKILEEEYNIERQREKKNIKSRARPQRMHFDGTPSAWKLPEEFKAVQNILNRPERTRTIKKKFRYCRNTRAFFIVCRIYHSG